MRKYGKKILGIVAAATMLCSVAVTAGCGKTNFKMTAPVEADYNANEGKVQSNGGFAVEKGNYVYFINGVESNTADNTYGKVEKGALMRITKAQLAAGEYGKADVVVPSLFVAQDYESGVYIYGDEVYYATPTTDKNLEGQVENGYIDFKSANLKTGKVMEGKFFHIPASGAKYRFVQEGDIVYCLYEEDGVLKSFNTQNRKTTVLVEGASKYVYDKSNPNNPNVYYTMSVTYNIATDNAMPKDDYNQLYCVNAAAGVKEVGKEENGKISYTVEGKEADNDGTYSKTYTFDAKYLKDKQEGFKASDYTTYPYVNLGQLVLDGVGSKFSEDETYNGGWFNEDNVADSLEFNGYTYELARYENGGVYFTRGVDESLYYVSDTRGESWNTIKANNVETTKELDVVEQSPANDIDATLFEVSVDDAGVRTHSYLYKEKEGSAIFKATSNQDGSVAQAFEIVYDAASANLWKTDGEYLYYYTDNEGGNGLSRVKYTGDKKDYDNLLNKEEFKPVTLPLVEWSKDWYKPEIIDLGNNQSVVLYANTQKYGSSLSTYNYVYAAKMGTTAKIQASIEKYEKYEKYYNGYSSNTDSQNLIKYFFSAGTLLSAEEMALEQTIIDLYKDESKAEAEQDAFYKEVVGKFTVPDGAQAADLATESEFIALVGKMTESDKESVKTAWKDFLLKPDAKEEEDNALPGWAVALIVVGSVLVVAAGAAVPVVFYFKKKAAAKKEAEAVVNAYRRKKIDTTDDKTINVYADEKKEESAENVEEKAEESVPEAKVEEEAETNE
jgi:hypothetical protein